MKVILTQDVKKVGKKGETVTVSDGYDYKGKKIRKTATFIPDPHRTEKQNQKALSDPAHSFPVDGDGGLGHSCYHCAHGISSCV